jgi:hypothetical protein
MLGVKLSDRDLGAAVGFMHFPSFIVMGRVIYRIRWTQCRVPHIFANPSALGQFYPGVSTSLQAASSRETASIVLWLLVSS